MKESLKAILSKEMLKSFYFFIKLFFIKKRYDIILVNSVFFNRGRFGENILFEPFVNICKELKLKCLIIEDTDLKGSYNNFKRNKYAIPYDFISLLSTILKKFYKKKIEELDKYEKEKFISNIIAKKFLFNLDASIYITLIWNNITLWRLISPDAIIIDYQHGITMNGHKGYLLNNKPPDIKVYNKVYTLVYSDTIKKILINNDNTNFYSDENVINIGVNNKFAKENNINSNIILFTLQITPDFNNQINKKYIEVIKNILVKNSMFFNTENWKILLKHHPRYSNAPDFVVNNDYASVTNKNIDKLLDVSKIHITFHSTSAIDAALKGIPTIFIDILSEFSPENIYFEQFGYPFKELLITKHEQLPEAIKFINNDYLNISETIYIWAKELHRDFDKEKMKGFILKNILNEK